MTTIKEFYIYYDGKLPDKGWFQCCILCDKITSKLHFYKNVNIQSKYSVNIYSYLCNTCKKQIYNKEIFNTYKTNCEELISNVNITDQ